MGNGLTNLLPMFTINAFSKKKHGVKGAKVVSNTHQWLIIWYSKPIHGNF